MNFINRNKGWIAAGLLFGLAMVSNNTRASEVIEIPLHTEYVGALPVCDRADQWARVLAEREEHGLAVSVALFNEIASKEKVVENQRACGVVEGKFVFTKLMWEGLVEGIPMAIVQVSWTNGWSKPTTVYTYVENAVIRDLKGARPS